MASLRQLSLRRASGSDRLRRDGRTWRIRLSGSSAATANGRRHGRSNLRRPRETADPDPAEPVGGAAGGARHGRGGPHRARPSPPTPTPSASARGRARSTARARSGATTGTRSCSGRDRPRSRSAIRGRPSPSRPRRCRPTSSTATPWARVVRPPPVRRPAPGSSMGRTPVGSAATAAKGSVASCRPTSATWAGLCCAPNCANRECGPDGCGRGRELWLWGGRDVYAGGVCPPGQDVHLSLGAGLQPGERAVPGSPRDDHHDHATIDVPGPAVLPAAPVHVCGPHRL